MIAGLAILDLGHLGKRSRGGDLGAQADMNHDQELTPDESEALFALEYMGAALTGLGRAGHDTLGWARGDYAFRHQRARSEAKRARRPAVYVQNHLNIGAAYGLVCYDHRSSKGQRLAYLVAGALDQLVPELEDIRVEAATPDGPWKNALHCIDGVHGTPEIIPGICYEPASLDRHRILLAGDGPIRIGQALAAGIHAYFQEQLL